MSQAPGSQTPGPGPCDFLIFSLSPEPCGVVTWSFPRYRRGPTTSKGWSDLCEASRPWDMSPATISAGGEQKDPGSGRRTNLGANSGWVMY